MKMNVLVTERLILREWKLSDSEDMFAYAQSELVGPNAGWKPHKDIDESKEIIKMFIKDQDVYAIELKAENKVIGSIGIHNRYPDEKLSKLNQREIGYVLNSEYWGKAFIPEAVQYLIKYCFEELKLDLIWCGHYDFNMKSKRVIEKCGFNYQFSKNTTLHLLDNKEVTTCYYNIYNYDYKNE